MRHELRCSEERWAAAQSMAHAYFDMAEALFPECRGKTRPEITYEVAGNVAGYACYGENKIKLNSDYLRTEFQDMMHDTIPHEVAHFVTHWVYDYGRMNPYGKRIVKPHGPQWRGVMLRLGVEPERCHNYKVIPAAAHTKPKAKRESIKL